MKKVKWSILLFIVLSIALSMGITYLALNQTASTTEEQTTKDDPNAKQTKKAHKMTIALVNEDQGAGYQGKQVNFGEDYVKKIEKDTSHDWYVVSRGVGESGLKRDVYNMMVVISNDFSQKALSITSDKPEKVTISYKVNETGNENLKTEAEKTASQILADMNRQLIDVYFASILTNLQEAQDNIGTLVKKEGRYFDKFDTNVQAPLSNYTEQFKTVQDYTKSSKEGFTGFQDLLKGYQQSLTENGTQHNDYNKQQESFIALQSENAPFVQALNDHLTKFNSTLSAEGVTKETSALEQANQLMTREFSALSEQNSLLTRTQNLQQYITNTNEKINQLDGTITTTLDSDLKKAVAEELTKILRANGEQPYNINQLSNIDINQGFESRIERLMMDLPSVKPEELTSAGLSDKAVSQYKNVIELSQKYFWENRSHFADDAKFSGTGMATTKLKDETVTALKEQGAALKSETFTIPASTYETKITANLAPGVHFTDINVIDEKGTTLSFTTNGINSQIVEITVPKVEADQSVKLTAEAKLNADINSLSIFGNVHWTAMMQQKEDKTIDVPNDNTIPPDNSGDTDSESEGNASEDTPKEINPSAENTVPNTGDITNPDDDAAGNKSIPTPEPEGKTISTDVNKDAVMIPVDDAPVLADKTQLTEAYRTTFQNYEKLTVLYQLYYGYNAANNEAMGEFFNSHKRLTEGAAPTSYYYIFNTDDVLNKIIGVSSDKITQAYIERLRAFRERITEFRGEMSKAESNSLDVSKRLVDTQQQARSLNENLAGMLKDLTAWREDSLALIKEDSDVIEKGKDEQQMTMQMNNAFGQIMSASESLTQSAGENLDSAKAVYDTFDAIDNEAKGIQASGTDLVNDASSLAKKMQTKFKEDKTFQKNFANVMKNSRTGDRQNESLYDFLSNPVEKVKAGTIVAGNKTIPYYLVLICAIVALFTAYVIASQEKKRRQTNQFAEEMSLGTKNLPITFLTVMTAIIEGMIIGFISANMFNIGDISIILWTGIIMLTMLALISGFTYLLRQPNMIGMFIVLILVSIYLFLTDAVGLGVSADSLLAKVRVFSPLQYLESLFNSIVNTNAVIAVTVYAIIGIAALFTMLNLFVWRKQVSPSIEEGKSA